MIYTIKNKVVYLKDNELIYGKETLLKDILSFTCALSDFPSKKQGDEEKLLIFAENTKGEVLIHSEGKTKVLMHGKIRIEQITGSILLCDLYMEKKLFVLSEDKRELTSYKNFFCLHKLGGICVIYLNKNSFGYIEFSGEGQGNFKEIYPREAKETSIVTTKDSIHALFTSKNKLIYSKISKQNSQVVIAEGEVENPLLNIIENKIYIFFTYKNRVYYSVDLDEPKLYKHKVSYGVVKSKVLGEKVLEVYVDPLKPEDVQIIEVPEFLYKDL